MTLNKYIVPVLIFIPIAIVQLTLVPLVSIESIAPDLVTIKTDRCTEQF